MSHAKVESHPGTTGYSLVLLVTLAVAIMIGTALLAAVGHGNLLTQQNLLYVALVFYAAAAVLYLGFTIAGRESHVHFAWLATGIGMLANALAAADRWYISGHPPFATMYETLLSFTLTLAILTLLVEWRFGIRLVGTVTMPLAVLSVILMQLLPSAARPLAPALQSTWLHVHVTMAMLGYAACAVSFALAMMFLIQDGVSNGTFLAWTSGLLAAVYAGVLLRANAAGGLALAAWDATEGREIFISQHNPLMVVIPGLGAVVLLALVALCAPLALFVYAKWKRSEHAMNWANSAFFIGIFFQVVATAVFLQRVLGGEYASPQAQGLFSTSPAASPFILAGLFTGITASCLYLLLVWRRPVLEQIFPPAEKLDHLTYKTISIALPLLTLMIATGAYWANRTWGAYWSWDPKETWALITWLTYVGYLHMRIARGWRGRRAAYFAIIGFSVVVFTFFGVTYLLPGMHAYA